MPNIQKLTKLALVSALVATAAMAQTPYDEGQKALRNQDWMEAVDYFEEAIKDDRSQGDAASYWMAYAYFKAGRRNEGERELRRLERNYPDSRWVKEGQALRIEYQDPDKSAAKIASGALEMDEEMKLFALMQLMERNPERTTPLVLDMVNNASSKRARRDALFLLAMSDEPVARQAVSDIARNSSDPAMQRQAIEMLGVMEATDELQALYPTQDHETRVAIIESLSIAGDTEMLRQILATETDPELRKAAIFGVAMHGDADTNEFAEEIYNAAQSVDEKLTVLDAMVMMDDAEELALKILKTESDPRLQMHAIHMLGIMDATGELAELYNNMPDRNVRMAVLEALSIADDSDALVDILESEKDPQLRSTAVQMLAINGSPEASAYLVDMYPGATRDEKRDIIQSMLVLDDADALLALMKQEEDSQLKREMLQMLSVMGSEEVDDALFELLEKEQ
ncbi:MAG: HEAT repeat domain-containing protein [Xanthomonadales bacterium]|jgi:HEAT repeat protein|nr:HEAT repeat domain-containing protein [Xanthomonadales bacterium]